jgi:hypothetical protein
VSVELVYPPDDMIPRPEDALPVPVWRTAYADKASRLLVDSLYTSWQGKDFQAFAGVTLGYQARSIGRCPDFMLWLDGSVGEVDRLADQPFLAWERGSSPNLVLELVRPGIGCRDALDHYDRIGVPYFIAYHLPESLDQAGTLEPYARTACSHRPLARPWFEGVGLGLTLQAGTYEGMNAFWPRWVDGEGRLLLTASEQIRVLEMRLRQLGENP